jgi:hypothetical protein
VPFNQGEISVDALRAAHVEVLFHPVEGGSHGSGGEFDSPALMDLVIEFLDRHLKDQGSADKERGGECRRTNSSK